MKTKCSPRVEIVVLLTVLAMVLTGGSLLAIKYSMVGQSEVDFGHELAHELIAVDKSVVKEDNPTETPTVKPQTDKVCTNEMIRVREVLIVNKKHCLSSTYNPGENPEAVAHLRELISAGRSAGVDLIYSWSGFRSYNTQYSLYWSYVNQDGQAQADTYSARPGFSEHQTGLTFDLKDHTGNLYRLGDSSYDPKTDWAALHAHEYGFIVRYFDATQGITGYTGEPWHLRYLGTATATAVYSSGLTLEEYLGVPGGDYAD